MARLYLAGHRERRVPHSAHLRRIQRAPYYYSNVTYRENSSLVDPFCPELGRTAPLDLAGRSSGLSSAIPLGLGQSAWAGEVFGPTLLNELHRKFGIPLEARWRRLSSRALYYCLVAFGLLAMAGAVLVATGREWFLALYFGVTVGMVALTWQSQFWRYLAPPRRSRWSSWCSPCLRFAGGWPLGASCGGEPPAKRWS